MPMQASPSSAGYATVKPFMGELFDLAQFWRQILPDQLLDTKFHQYFSKQL